MLVEESNFRKDTIHELIHNQGVWCPRLPKSRMDKLLRDSWVEETIQLGLTPLSVSDARSSGDVEDGETVEDGLKQFKTRADEGFVGTNLLGDESPCRRRQRLRYSCDIKEAPVSDDFIDPHRYDIKLPFLINEILDFLNFLPENKP